MYIPHTHTHTYTHTHTVYIWAFNFAPFLVYHIPPQFWLRKKDMVDNLFSKEEAVGKCVYVCICVCVCM